MLWQAAQLFNNATRDSCENLIICQIKSLLLCVYVHYCDSNSSDLTYVECSAYVLQSLAWSDSAFL